MTKAKNYISFLSNCPQTMINNLNNTYQNFPEMIINSNKNLILKDNLFDINSMITSNINNILLYFNYIIYNADDDQPNYTSHRSVSLTYWKLSASKSNYFIRYFTNSLIACIDFYSVKC